MKCTAKVKGADEKYVNKYGNHIEKQEMNGVTTKTRYTGVSAVFFECWH